MSEAIRAEAVVVGGGLSGLAAAACVAAAGIEVVHLAPRAPHDRRTSALMGPSVDYLRQAGLIGAPDELGHALTQIRIIDATHRLIRAPETLFDSHEAGLDAFGWNFANTRLLEAFSARLAAHGNVRPHEALLGSIERVGSAWRLTLSDGAVVETPLVVGADGKKSRVREGADFRAHENGFTQAALVADLDLGRPLGGTSVEFHYEQGPFTLVPAGGNRANLVWIDDRMRLEAARALAPEDLAKTLEAKSQHLFGGIRLASSAHIFLLSTLTVKTAGQNGVVLVGEAAHAFPPIGAQGLNLGLRDVADLARSLAAIDRGRPDWAEGVSADFARRRVPDLARTGAVVDTLFRSLLTGFLPAQALRAGGLWALRALPGLRREAFRVGMGG